MLMIRREQMQGLAGKASPEFVEFMTAHLRKSFPAPASLWSPEDIHELVQQGATTARTYGFETGRQLCLYIDLSVELGIGFDTDVQLPWAAEILSDPGISTADRRMDRLFDAATRYLDAVAGKDQVFAVRPLQKMIHYPVAQLDSRLERGVVQGVLGEFREIWPQKYRRVTPERLSRLIEQGMPQAASYGFTERKTLGGYLIFMYMLGHHFDRDPQYPWAPACLGDPEVQTPTERFDRLHSAAMAALSKATERGDLPEE